MAPVRSVSLYAKVCLYLAQFLRYRLLFTNNNLNSENVLSRRGAGIYVRITAKSAEATYDAIRALHSATSGKTG